MVHYLIIIYIKYTQPYENTNRSRNRKVLWFSPPFIQNVKTNIGKIFIKLIKKLFPKDHELDKIFKTNSIKLSYSCMPNMSKLIKQHIQKVLSSSQTNEKCQCNCRNPASYPLDGKCFTKSIVYKIFISIIIDSHTYYGSSEDFKFRYNNHTKSFLHKHCKNDAELSRHIRDLKNKESGCNITWSIAAYASA